MSRNKINHNLNKEDALQFVKDFNIQRSETAPYIVDGKKFSLYEDESYGYRIQPNGGDQYYLFVFSKKNNKFKQVIEYSGDSEKSACGHTICDFNECRLSDIFEKPEVIGKHVICDCERCLSRQSKGTWLN